MTTTCHQPSLFKKNNASEGSIASASKAQRDLWNSAKLNFDRKKRGKIEFCLWFYIYLIEISGQNFILSNSTKFAMDVEGFHFAGWH